MPLLQAKTTSRLFSSFIVVLAFGSKEMVPILSSVIHVHIY